MSITPIAWSPTNNVVVFISSQTLRELYRDEHVCRCRTLHLMNV